MSSDERFQKRGGVRLPMLILGGTMTLLYLVLGSYLMIDKSFLPGVPTEFRNIFAFMLLVYGLYRGWRTYADYW